ncbi:hypothetical protein JTE90_028219 [Oedothorax gibbosus]|uniref:Uncharacterized protein n=1 Tax=Oedothorax gibbosus TaxID=931172 RepID=A0AAV6TUF0_9ARAC|nr:hypothetical protein JTE90_028219 [Oedothorax gibbosus]
MSPPKIVNSVIAEAEGNVIPQRVWKAIPTTPQDMSLGPIRNGPFKRVKLYRFNFFFPDRSFFCMLLIFVFVQFTAKRKNVPPAVDPKGIHLHNIHCGALDCLFMTGKM